jgi:hypothetical protein
MLSGMVLCTELALYILIENWDSNMGDSADWNEENTKILCELFAEQVKAHNCSGTHLNRTGYMNVMEKYKERTGLAYRKIQFKNKWDKMRSEYANWKRLAKETGLGWDPVKKTYAWWKKENKVNICVTILFYSCTKLNFRCYV